MIEIKKGREPEKLLLYRQKENASYESMDADVKAELLDRLLREQGHLCAYCMRRIPEKRNLPNGVPKVSIEHWFPRSKGDVKVGLDYHNMFAVCSGNRDCHIKEKMTCDAARGNIPLTVNPCKADTLSNIKYTSNGLITSDDDEIKKELNDVLRLNNESVSLPENRKQALEALILDVNKHKGSGDISLYCKRKLEQLKGMQDKKLPYVGIMIWWLSKHVG